MSSKNDLTKALRCLASIDKNKRCYMERENPKRRTCGEPLLTCLPDGKHEQCPFYQNTYKIGIENGKCSEWLEKVADEYERLQNFKEYFDELYGKGLEIANWHLNEEMEPFDSFYESALQGKEKQE